MASGAVCKEDFQDLVKEAAMFLEGPHDCQLACVNLIIKKGNAVGGMVGQLLSIDTRRAVGPGVATWDAKDDIS